jgi:hypothetical protein
MKSLEELNQAIKDKKVLVWNDPDPIKGNDYTISFIENLGDLDENDIVDYPIHIQYGRWNSEAEVFLHEILAL